MPLQQTPELGIKSVSLSPGPPRKITFRFTTPYPPALYLGTLTLVENNQISGYSGRLNPGTPTQAGNGVIQVNHDKFQAIWAFVSHTQLSLLISFDDVDDTVLDLEISSTQPLINIDTLEGVLTSLAGVDVAGGISSLNQIAQTLTLALQTFTPMNLRAAAPAVPVRGDAE